MDVIFEFEKTAAILFSITYVERRIKKVHSYINFSFQFLLVKSILIF